MLESNATRPIVLQVRLRMEVHPSPPACVVFCPCRRRLPTPSLTRLTTNLPSKELRLADAFHQTPCGYRNGATIRFVRRIILIAALTFAFLFQGGCVGTSNQPFSLVQPGTLEFPQEAKEAGETKGSVVVEYDIEVDGTVSNLLIVSSDPPDLFDKEALRFVGAWRFRPAYEKGSPVATRGVQSTIRFELSSEEIEIPVP